MSPTSNQPRYPMAVVHLTETPAGHILVSAIYQPPIVRDEAHVMTNIEAVAARMIRAAIDAGAREVS